MPLLVNSIGEFEFIALSGVIVPPQQSVMLDSRPAVDGSEKILMGNKGDPFALISQVDVASYDACWDLLAEYQSLTQADVQTIVQGGRSSNAYTPPYSVQVLRVTLAEPPRAIVGAIQGINPPSLGWLVCRWDLVSVPD